MDKDIVESKIRSLGLNWHLTKILLKRKGLIQKWKVKMSKLGDVLTVAIIELLARLQPLISKTDHVDLNQRMTKMLIDKSKMALDSSVRFLNCRKAAHQS